MVALTLSPLESRVAALVARVAVLEDEVTAGLPPSASVPVDLRISAAGQLYHDAMTMVASDTGLVYRVMITGSPPALEFVPIPTVADIRGDFASVADLRAAVPTVSALRTWGF